MTTWVLGIKMLTKALAEGQMQVSEKWKWTLPSPHSESENSAKRLKLWVDNQQAVQLYDITAMPK